MLQNAIIKEEIDRVRAGGVQIDEQMHERVEGDFTKWSQVVLSRCP